MYQKYRFTGSQGPSGPGYGPLTAYGMAIMGREAIASSFLPMAVAQDMMSYASY